MAQTFSHDRPRSQGRTYTDEEWERVKQPFHYYYIEKNMALKEAARKIAQEYNFDATLRQWERRIAPEKWNFPKYANREERLKQIEKSGKSLLEVSHRGRRRSIASDGRPGLTEDRNLRRFARREVSRDTRPRAKSVSELSDASDQEMTGTSAAPSPSASEMYMESQNNTPFPMSNFEDMDENWMSGVPSSQGSNPAPRIEFSSHDDLDIPSIIFSGPEEHVHLAQNDIPMERQLQTDVDYSHTQGQDSLPPFPTESSTMWPSDPSAPTNIGWTTSNHFNHPPVEVQDVVPDLDFGAFGAEANLSYTAMLSDQPHVDTTHVAMESHLDAFNNENLDLQNDTPTPVTPTEAMPNLDNTHADVHALMQDHYEKTLKMVRFCLQGCYNISGEDDSKRQAIEHLKLLERGIRAQNEESDRGLRSTLKDISATQRRATRDIYELSSRRKRKIEDLKKQLNDLSQPINEQSAFGYG